MTTSGLLLPMLWDAQGYLASKLLRLRASWAGVVLAAPPTVIAIVIRVSLLAQVRRFELAREGHYKQSVKVMPQSKGYKISCVCPGPYQMNIQGKCITL